MSNSGLFLVEQEDFGGALRAFRKSLQLEPYQPEAYINIGIAYEGLGDVEQAIAAYERAIFIHAADSNPYYNLGRVYYTILHQPDRALSCFLKAVELNPFDRDTRQYLGEIYRERGDFEAARREAEIAGNLR